MKKIFTLLTILAVAIAAKAQVVLCDPQGNEYSDGQTMIILPEIEEGEGFVDVLYPAPMLKNKGNADAQVAIEFNIRQLPEYSQVQMCYPGPNCFMKDAEGTYTTETGVVKAGETISSAIEWNVARDWETDEPIPGTCVIDYALIVNGTKSGAVTVNFVYADPSGIQSVQNGVKKVVAAYGINGQRLNGNAHGIVIEKMSDGSVVKTVK